MSVPYDFSSQRSFTPYPNTILPKGFLYPEGYLEHSREMLYPMKFPWWFTDASAESGKDWEFRFGKEGKDWASPKGINPIPFARNGELAAYFDGSDHSGDPSIYVVHLPDSVCIAHYDNFAAWLSSARKEGGVGDPPYDKVTSSPSYQAAVERSDGYYFCPNCYEPNWPVKEYDEAICCVNCKTLFNL